MRLRTISGFHRSARISEARAIGRVFGRTPEIAFGEPRAGDIRESLGNPVAALDALGFSAKFGIEEGLGLMAAYEGK